MSFFLRPYIVEIMRKRKNLYYKYYTSVSNRLLVFQNKSLKLRIVFQHHLIAFEILSDFSEIEEIRIKKNKDIIVHNYKMVVLRETVKKTFTKKQMYNCATFFTLTHCKKTRDQKNIHIISGTC